MKLKKISALFFTVLMLAGPASAEEALHDYDPMKRNLIFVSGSAEMTVPVNRFSLTFGFDVEKGSFRDTQEASSKITEGISAKARALGNSELEIVKGWDLVRQAKISLGSKGRKISNRLIVKVSNFPQGKMHEMIAALIDGSLSVDGAVELQEVQVSLSDELDKKKKDEVVLLALKNLQTSAKASAEALGRSLSPAPKQVSISEQPHTMAAAADSMMGGYGAPMMRQSMISVQKSFNVQSEIVDQLKISVNVNGVYELE